jgi:nitrous oxidase accessory protein
MRRRGWLLLGVLLLASAPARTLTLTPGDPLPALQAGDTLQLQAGVHAGPWLIEVDDVHLQALPGAILDGGGEGSALSVYGQRVRVEGLRVQNVGPGVDLYAPDAALRAIGADDLVVVGLEAHGVSAGVHVEDASRVVLRGLDLRGTGAGPGITTYLTPDLHIEGGSLGGFLDGVYLERVEGGVVRDLRVEGSSRYGLHAMFSRDLLLEGNRVIGGAVGSAVMYGRAARIVGNRFEGHRGPMAFGLLLHEEQGSEVRDNELVGNTIGLLLVAASGAQVLSTTLRGNGVGVLVDRLGAASDAAATSVSLAGLTFLGNAADIAVADADAALTLRGNRFDRVPNLDLDGDGVIDLPFVATSAFAAHAARIPDLLLLAFGPGIALWQRLEASVPGVRGASFADPEPRIAPAWQREPGAGVAALGLALLLGLAGMVVATPRRGAR